MIDASKECRIYLMDTESIGGDDHRTPVYRTPLICNEMVDFAEAGIWGSLATWEDNGTRWIVTPFWGPKAFPVLRAPRTRRSEEGRDCGIQDGRDRRQGAVDSRLDFARHEPGRAAGDRQRHDLRIRQRREYRAGVSGRRAWISAWSGAFRFPRTPCSTRSMRAPADELWSSGDQIKTWNHWSGLALANGHVYINTYDGQIYCFGLNK